MTATSPRSTASRRKAASPEDYAAFIRQVELTTVWLTESHVVNHRGPETPGQATIHLATDARWELVPDGFTAFHSYQGRIQGADATLAEVDVTFGLHFASKAPMTAELFALFSEANLPVNTWPYTREFIATMLGRMNWLPFTLPTLKRGTGSASQRSSSPRQQRKQTGASK